MFKKPIIQDTGQLPMPKEGDLYRVFTISGKTFAIYYGYYEEFERYGQYSEPIPIYPDFQVHPQYTSDGIPFVTAMQDICRHYNGVASGDSCAECAYFQKCEELFGLCTYPDHRKRPSG